MLNALFAGKACVLLPYDDSDLTQQLPTLSDELWLKGGIGGVSEDLEHALSGRVERQVSRAFFSNLDQHLKYLASEPLPPFDFQSRSEMRSKEIGSRTSEGGKRRPSSDGKGKFEEWLRRFAETAPNSKTAWRRLLDGIQ